MYNEDELHQIQLDMEQDAVDIGIKRYRDAVAAATAQGNETSLPPQQRLMVTAITPVMEALKKALAEESDKAGRKNTALKTLKLIKPEIAAFLTAKIILDGIGGRAKATQISIHISNCIRDHISFEDFRKEHPRLYKYAEQKAKHSSNANYRKNSMRHYAQYAGTPVTTVSLTIGAYLLDLFIKTTGLVVIETITTRGKSDSYLRAQPEVVAWVRAMHSECELLRPAFMPMVVKPLGWTNPWDGGYLTHQVCIIKTANKSYLQELENTDIDNVYRTMNALQDTPWKVNQAVLGVANELWASGAIVPPDVLPLLNAVDVPDLPCSTEEVDAYKVAHPQEWVEWKQKVAAAHTTNRRNDSKRISVSQKLWVANKMSSFDELYFPHTMDWRGRVYPIVPLLNPQSDDLGKALLEFSYGAALGEHGEKWLKVNLANTFGVDKVTLEERIKWAEEHEMHILMCAADPFTYKMWMETKTPWQFLASCMEWAKYKESGLGKEFISTISVNMDGSCNGLQNFSAMLLDEIGGAATNLVAQPTPADIYAQVAKLVQKKIEADLANPMVDDAVKTWASMWNGKLSRDLVKRQVMTLPYGSTKFGMRDQLRDVLRELRTKNIVILNTDNHTLEWECVIYLTQHVWDAIGEVVVSAVVAMDWLREVAVQTSELGLPIHWYAPSGLPVLQEYRRSMDKQLDTVFGGTRIRRNFKSVLPEIDKLKQANGVAPNYVHSCDASHMVATVNRCLDIGIQDFSMIHDSYGTHAGNLEALNVELRDAFIEQYSKPVLVTLKADLERQIECELPAVPPMGKLDLEGIRDSQYFFA